MSTFVSYAQNFEDVMLYRALGDVQCGFYVDVGAQHPLRDSVTRAFYERGWRGINIEPVAEWHGLLNVDRPEDTNLRVAVAASADNLAFYEVADTGLSTSDADLAAQHASEGFDVKFGVVSAMTLDAILEKYANPQIHFLKIDVEGAEREVLTSVSLDRYRPWIVVVEATSPNTQDDVSVDWEHLLLERRYALVYSDGLNRFYLADEHKHLAIRFKYPPNFFDNFVRHVDWERAEKARRLEGELAGIEDRLREVVASRDKLIVACDEKERENARLLDEKKQLDQRYQALTVAYDSVLRERDSSVRQIASLEAQMQRIFASRSWKITAPLRAVSRLLHGERARLEGGGANLPAVGARAPAASALQAASLPDEGVLLERANRSVAPARSEVPPLRLDARFDQLTAELEALLAGPQSLPPKLRRMPGMNTPVLRTAIIRVYERLFRRQALIDSKIIEALTIIRNQRRAG